MLAVFHPDQLLHAPAHFIVNGRKTPSPEQPGRAVEFLASVQTARVVVETPDLARGVTALARVHAPDYIEFLRHGHTRWRDELGASGEVVPKIHPSGAGLSHTEAIEGLAGYYEFDNAAPLGAGTWRSIRACAATTDHAATRVVRGDADAAYALCRPGGHHAGRASAMGFCYLNNAAIAAEVLRERFGRVAIIDIDVHHGNGTQRIFESRGDIVTVSIHADPARFYPFYTGYANERGIGEGRGANRNIPLPPGSGSREWLAAVGSAVDTVRASAAGALVISLGLDGHRDDPLGAFELQSEDFAAAARYLRAPTLPTVIVQEGGYLHHETATALMAFLAAFDAP